MYYDRPKNSNIFVLVNVHELRLPESPRQKKNIFLWKKNYYQIFILLKVSECVRRVLAALQKPKTLEAKQQYRAGPHCIYRG